MDEFTIGFEDNAVWRELTFRGVSENVAKAMATGLADAGSQLRQPASCMRGVAPDC